MLKRLAERYVVVLDKKFTPTTQKLKGGTEVNVESLFTFGSLKGANPESVFLQVTVPGGRKAWISNASLAEPITIE